MAQHILLGNPEARTLIREAAASLPLATTHPEDAVTVTVGEYQVHLRKALGTWLPQSIYRG